MGKNEGKEVKEDWVWKLKSFGAGLGIGMAIGIIGLIIAAYWYSGSTTDYDDPPANYAVSLSGECLYKDEDFSFKGSCSIVERKIEEKMRLELQQKNLDEFYETINNRSKYIEEERVKICRQMVEEGLENQ